MTAVAEAVVAADPGTTGEVDAAPGLVQDLGTVVVTVERVIRSGAAARTVIQLR